MAEIGAVNMGEIAAVRKRFRQETGPRDSSPCVARVKILVFLSQALTRAATFAQGRASQCGFHAIAVGVTAFSSTTAQQFSTLFACFREVTPHNVPLPSTNAYPAPPCCPFRFDQWFDWLPPAINVASSIHRTMSIWCPV